MVTAFVLDSYKSLETSTNGDSPTTSIVLRHLLPTSEIQLATSSENNKMHVIAVWINILWFSSLVTSVSSAFLAILTKEWLADLLDGRNDAHMGTRGRQLQLRFDSIQKWSLSQVLPLLPFLLHTSFLFFFAGLVTFLWYINRTVAIVAATLVCLMTLAYCWTHLRSILSANCPYRTSLTSLILLSIDSIWIQVSWHLPSVIGKFWVVIAVTRKIREAKDFELYRVAWDVMIMSWFRAKWRSALAAFRGFHILPTPQDGYWPDVTAFGTGNALRLREDAYLSDPRNISLMNARALARIINRLPQGKDMIHSALDELCEFSALVRRRSILIHAGAIQALARQLSRLDASSRRLRYAHTLVRLLTEAEPNADDARTITFVVKGVPIPWDIRLQRLPSWIPNRYQLEDTLARMHLPPWTGVITQDLEQSPSSIILETYFLRLQIVQMVLLEPTARRGRSDLLLSSVDRFYEDFLSDHFSTIVGRLDDDQLLSLVNTTIYIGMNRHKFVSDYLMAALLKRRVNQYVFKSLAALTAVMDQRPGMPISVLRQTCWGIWMLSMPTSRMLSGLLVPVMTSTSTLGPLLADLLEKAAGDIGEKKEFSATLLTLLRHVLFRQADRGWSERIESSRYTKQSQSESGPLYTDPTSILEHEEITGLCETLWRGYMKYSTIAAGHMLQALLPPAIAKITMLRWLSLAEPSPAGSSSSSHRENHPGPATLPLADHSSPADPLSDNDDSSKKSSELLQFTKHILRISLASLELAHLEMQPSDWLRNLLFTSRYLAVVSSNVASVQRLAQDDHCVSPEEITSLRIALVAFTSHVAQVLCQSRVRDGMLVPEYINARNDEWYIDGIVQHTLQMTGTRLARVLADRMYLVLETIVRPSKLQIGHDYNTQWSAQLGVAATLVACMENLLRAEDVDSIFKEEIVAMLMKKHEEARESSLGDPGQQDSGDRQNNTTVTSPSKVLERFALRNGAQNLHAQTDMGSVVSMITSVERTIVKWKTHGAEDWGLTFGTAGYYYDWPDTELNTIVGDLNQRRQKG